MDGQQEIELIKVVTEIKTDMGWMKNAAQAQGEAIHAINGKVEQLIAARAEQVIATTTETRRDVKKVLFETGKLMATAAAAIYLARHGIPVSLGG